LTVVTGGSGFLGRAVVARLSALGASFVAPTTAEWNLLSDSAAPAAAVDHVIHLAGRTSVVQSWDDPAGHYAINAGATVRVLDLCRRNGWSITYISSYVYGIPDRLPIPETAPLRPNNPYAFSKVAGEDACRFFHRTYDVPVTVLRPFNFYGNGQSTAFLIPKIVEQVIDPRNEIIEVADLAPRRDFVHVDDVVSAIISTAGHPGYSVFNVGAGRSYSVAEVIEAALAAANRKKPFRGLAETRHNEIPDVRADISAIAARVGWRPTIELNEGLSRMIREATKQ
jgi:nucleoside-diphosphate-sugar epimerase